MKKILFILLIISNAIFSENSDQFAYQHEPINPACVALFNQSLADRPYISAVNLSTCQHSNVAYQKTLIHGNNTYSFYFNNKDDSAGEYSYQAIGKTLNGIYVLLTKLNEGGSGVFSDLLLVRIVQDQSYDYDLKNAAFKSTPFTALKLLGSAGGGDRCEGVASANVMGNKLVVEQYQGDNPGDCRKIKKYVIDLSTL